MRNKRVLQFSLAGLLIALALQVAGYLIDHAVPRIALGDQAVYNWLTLLLSPASFFLRLGDPEGPIVAGWSSFLVVLPSNALLYAVSCRAAQAFLLRFQVKLAHENIPALAERHPERIIRLSTPHWKPRRA